MRTYSASPCLGGGFVLVAVVIAIPVAVMVVPFVFVMMMPVIPALIITSGLGRRNVPALPSHLASMRPPRRLRISIAMTRVNPAPTAVLRVARGLSFRFLHLRLIAFFAPGVLCVHRKRHTRCYCEHRQNSNHTCHSPSKPSHDHSASSCPHAKPLRLGNLKGRTCPRVIVGTV